MQKAATRSPARTAAPSGALRTTPATSLPGTNGSGGLIWYSPRVCSSSGKDTPAARTSTTTPRPGVIGWLGSGSGSSASASAPSGPLSSVIWTARIGGGSYRREVQARDGRHLGADLVAHAVERVHERVAVLAGLHRHLRGDEHLARAEVD